MAVNGTVKSRKKQDMIPVRINGKVYEVEKSGSNPVFMITKDAEGKIFVWRRENKAEPSCDLSDVRRHITYNASEAKLEKGKVVEDNKNFFESPVRMALNYDEKEQRPVDVTNLFVDKKLRRRGMGAVAVGLARGELKKSGKETVIFPKGEGEHDPGFYARQGVADTPSSFKAANVPNANLSKELERKGIKVLWIGKK